MRLPAPTRGYNSCLYSLSDALALGRIEPIGDARIGRLPSYPAARTATRSHTSCKRSNAGASAASRYSPTSRAAVPSAS